MVQYFYYSNHFTSYSPFCDNNLFSNEIFWVAFGSIMTGAALVYTILKSRFDQKKEIENIKKALYFELITNIRMLFSGEVERNSLFDINSIVRKKFIKDIDNQELYSEIQELYSELDFYNKFVNKVYLNPNIKNNGKHTTEKQLSTMNKFLDFFELQEIVRLPKETWDQARDRGIKQKNKKFSSWEKELQQKIEQLF